ncbi:FHA domain-containing protein [Sandaracinus amylolyticus]|uniref:Adenylate cyclase n=1 Tax=Sandaracinus amylolyticus TaxID=927083 RepID=A0A0F6W3I7_9BACT|nr:FHA domain-containing protein [Sandaracinus amylolyticus]AKF06377.1 Adenylate cyclase [Sandaracinus amylolyticus]UJR81005.1 Glycogen accumulation regulator GarA [Sandaracinus amylolyticus]
MPRFRLRFLLQEFDLVGPEVVIGRSPDCHITIEDPLISRRHARVVIHDDTATVQDLGSRNGVRVNGRLIKGEQVLREGDRIRIGTQELVFAVVRAEQRAARPTGYMRVCHSCNTPYPEGSPQCPHCGAPPASEEDTMSGVMVEPKRSWTFQLLGEVIERALASGKALEAERLMRRAAKEVDERLAAGERLDPAHVSMIAQFAVRLARLVGGSEWVAWVLTLHRRQGMMLSDDVIDRIEEVDLDAFPDAKAVLDGYLAWFRSQHAGAGPSPDFARLTRLEQLRRG